MIDPDKLYGKGLEATDLVAGASSSPHYTIAAFLDAVLADNEAMIRMAHEYHSHEVKSWKASAEAMRKALAVAVQEPE